MSYPEKVFCLWAKYHLFGGEAFLVGDQGKNMSQNQNLNATILLVISVNDQTH
jgi:hypothetical protein